ncbi:MAG: leucine-rich repeat domain-containing protein [Clostridia bacterium]|nr:leucine-rich repeat domain-containing protein [Clostridia bacterium]
MKKKLLLVVAIMAIVTCFLALSISAAGSTSNEFAETPDTIEGIAAPSNISANERVVMLGNDGLYYTFPAYYILNDNKTCSLKTNNLVNSVLGYADGTSHKAYVVRIEIPNGATYIAGNFLDYNNNLVYAKMSDTVTNTGTKVFQGCKNLETLILSNSLTVIQNDFCKDCSNLSSPIVIPSTVTAIKGYCFNGCNKLSSITNYAENVTSIDGNAFAGCPITEFNFPDKLTSIGQSAFHGAQFASIDLPNSITTLGAGVFMNCTQLTYVRFPEKLTQVPHDSLKGTNGKSITIVVPKGCTSIYSQYSLGNSGITKIIFTGTPDSDFVKSVTEKASGWVSKIEYANHCDYYYDGVHTPDAEKSNACVELCANCGKTTIEHDVNAEMSIVLAYGDFSKVGTKTTKCLNEGCSLNTAPSVEEVKELFTCRGYSVPENGDGGITIGYVVNYDAIEYYEQLTGEAVGFGVFAVLKDRLGSNDIFDAEGKASDGVISADLSNSKFTVFQLKVVGFKDEQKDVKLAMGAYVATTENGETTYSYMQYGDVAEGEKYAFASYNDVLQMVSDSNKAE